MVGRNSSPSSADLKNLAKRVKASALAADDKAILSDMLSHSIKLKSLLEKSGKAVGGKKVLASLPFGFDIVK